MRRRFFEGFKECIEGRSREHVNFVNDVNFELSLRWRKVDLVAQVAHVFDTSLGGGVDFDQVHEAVVADGFAMVALVAGTFGFVFVQAVNGFRQQARERGLACAARPREQKRVTDAIRRDGIAERLHYMLLADNFGPTLRAIFSVEGLGHFLIIYIGNGLYTK